MTLKSVTKIAFATLLSSQILFANPTIEQSSDVMNAAWKVRELSATLANKPENRQAFEAAQKEFLGKSREMARELVEKGTWKEFSEYYKGLDTMGKQNLEVVVEGIVQEVFHKEDRSGIELQRAQEYFPGYGYAKPGYTYRKGEEVKREHLYAYWKDEVIDEMTSLNKELMIEIKLLAKLKAAIPELIEGVKLDIEIDGSIHEVVKIQIKKEVKIHTKQKRKFGVEKVWFKLYEAKKKWWGDLEWKFVGNTFQNDTMPTGEDVIVEATVEDSSDNS